MAGEGRALGGRCDGCDVAFPHSFCLGDWGVRAACCSPGDCVHATTDARAGHRRTDFSFHVYGDIFLFPQGFVVAGRLWLPQPLCHQPEHEVPAGKDKTKKPAEPEASGMSPSPCQPGALLDCRAFYSSHP